MRSEERRQEILKLLLQAKTPISAGVLKQKFGVSRQIIVQDIAILRSGGRDITATNRGYILNSDMRSSRVFKCRHTFEEVLEECALIVEEGGRVEDVFVNHRLYGKLSAPLNLDTRVHVEELYRSLLSGASKPLMNVTDGFHYHTVTAASEDVLDRIEDKLRLRGFLVEI